MTDVGDAVTLTFETTTGATVTAEVTSPAGTTTSPVNVPEAPAASGKHPYTFVPSAAGVWQVVFRSTSPTAVEEYQVTARAVSDPPPLASSEDVADLWRPLTTAEAALAKTLLRYASKMIRGRITDLDTRITAGDLDADLAVLVAARMVLRVLQNPVAAVKSETVGPYSVTYDTAVAIAHLALDDADLALLATPEAVPLPRARSVTVKPTLWWEL